MSGMINLQAGDALLQCQDGDCRLETLAGSFSLSTGRKARMRFAMPLPPLFDILTERDSQTWLQINPEAKQVRNEVGRILQTLRPGERLPATSISTRQPGRISPVLLPTKQP